MDLGRHPAVAPALAVLVGTGAAPGLPHLPVAPILLLVCLASALGRPWSRLLAAAALGTLNAALFWVLPERQAPVWQATRPVTAWLDLEAPWRRGSFGWWTHASVARLRQGSLVGRGPRRAIVSLPDEGRAPGPGPLTVRGFLKREAGFANFGVETSAGFPRLAVKSHRLMRREPGGGLLMQAGLGWRLRRWVEGRLGGSGRGGPGEGSTAGSPGEALLRALALGDRSRLPRSWQAGLRRFGLSHLLAVSGLHVGILVAPILLAGRRLPGGIGVLAAVAAVGAYLLLVGPRPSLVRAAVMVLLLLGAHRLARPPQLLNSLAVVAAGVAFASPSTVTDLGFQLTVSATAGILVLGRYWSARWLGAAGAPRQKGLPRPLGEGLAVSLGAQVAALPWSLPSFHLVSPLSPLLNLVAVPWTGLCLLLALGVLFLVVISPPLGGLGIRLLDLMALPFGWPGGVPPLGWESLVVRVDFFGAGLLALGIVILLSRPRRLVVVVLGAGALLAALRGAGERRLPELVMLDVGQGDAILLRDGDASILVDGGGFRGGGDFAARVLLPALRAAGVTALDVMAMTHPDRDHCGGLVDLTRYLRVRELWLAEGWPPTGCAGELVAQHRGRLRFLGSGDRIRVGSWRFEILHPPRTPGGRPRPRNAHSLVLRATTGEHRLLLTGDVDELTERRILQRFDRSLSSHVLKLAHHGSRSSTSESFLNRVDPRLALASAGAGNPYGHPSPVVMARLARQRVPVLRTDLHGAVRLQLPPRGPLRLETRGRE